MVSTTKRAKIAPMVAIVGQTASGKTSLAIEAAEAFGGEVIAADSRTFYRGLDIGTAKPTSAERSRIPHHMIDIAGPGDDVTAAEFKIRAQQTIRDILRRGSLPILVGGSGLYIDSLLYDYQFSQPNTALRTQLESASLQRLVDLFVETQPERARTIDLKNRRRVQRALETRGQKPDRKPLRSNTLVLGIDLNNETVHERIRARAKEMVEDGLLKEVAREGVRYGWESQAMQAPAYRSFRPVVEDRASPEEGLTSFIKADTALARRQRTWFRRNTDIVWVQSTQEAMSRIQNFLQGLDLLAGEGEGEL